MTANELKEYTKRAKELEAAIYTQKKLMKEHNIVIKNNAPLEPVIEEVAIKKPTQPQLINYTSQLEFKNALLSGGSLTVFGVPIIISGVLGEMFIVVLIGLLVGAMGIYLLYDGIYTCKWNKERQKNGHSRYEKDLKEYDRELARYNNAVDDAKKLYEERYAVYSLNADKHNKKKLEMEEKHNNALASLEYSLAKLYEENVVFPKYRNMVAITTINEYLESGRCYELEGPDGAYNLYEMELRQNIVIGQLSNIISNLEQIRNNQFSLYEELQKSNRKIDDIIYELKVLQDETKLNAYFNYVTAVAETSPKITHGIIY